MDRVSGRYYSTIDALPMVTASGRDGCPQGMSCSSLCSVILYPLPGLRKERTSEKQRAEKLG